MSYKKWIETDTPLPKPQNFPWGTLGTLIIITVSSVLFAGLIFFIYSGKYERSLMTLTKEREENRQYITQVEDLQHTQKTQYDQIRSIEDRLNEIERRNRSQHSTSDDTQIE